MDYFSIVARRERALKFCYGYYLMPASDEDVGIQSGLSMVSDPRPLSGKEKDGIVRLIEEDPSVRKHYISIFQSETK